MQVAATKKLAARTVEHQESIRDGSTAEQPAALQVQGHHPDDSGQLKRRSCWPGTAKLKITHLIGSKL